MIGLLFVGTGLMALFSDRDSAPKKDVFGADEGLDSGLIEPDPIETLKTRLRKVQELAKKPAIDALGRVDTEVETNVRSIITTAPSELIGTVKDVVLQASEGKGPVADLVKNVAADDIDSAIEAIEAIQDAIKKSPAVKKITNKALEALDKQGILGSGPLSTVISILGASLAGTLEAKRFSEGGKLTLTAPGFSISASRLGDFAVSVKTKNPLWVRQAVSLAVSGSATAPSPFTAASIKLPTQVSRGVTLSPYASVSEKERKVGLEAKVKF